MPCAFVRRASPQLRSARTLTCIAICDGVIVGPFGVIDVGATGFAATFSEEMLSPGTNLDALELMVDGKIVWNGAAVVVHCDLDRFGARFTSGLFDLQALRIEATLENRLAVLREQQLRLPSAWRAAVSDLRQLLESAKLEVEEFERTREQDPIHHAEDEAALFAGLRDRWGSAYFAAVRDLFDRSKMLDPQSVSVGYSYAASALLPLLLACPVHRRAYEKPLGYAGDFRFDGDAFHPRPDGRWHVWSLHALNHAELHPGPRRHCARGGDA